MKTKNQSEQTLLDLGDANAANEDGISPPVSRDARDMEVKAHSQAWSPYEVWNTRVKTLSRPRPVDSAPR